MNLLNDWIMEKRPEELKELTELVCSSNYKERFLGEYWSLKLRAEKLAEMIKRWEEGTLTFAPVCSQDILKEHEYQFKDQQNQINELGNRATSIENTNEQILETLDGIAATGGASTAEAVVYNNNDSPLKAINVKQALDELANSKKYLTQEQYDDLVRIGEVKEDVEYNILEEE